jgi:sugar phosphate isomerase/epimerase
MDATEFGRLVFIWPDAREGPSVAANDFTFMSDMTRRSFIQRTAQGALLAEFLAGGLASLSGAETKPRKMTRDLVCGNLGISVRQPEAVELAARYGFESVGVDGGYLEALDAKKLDDLKSLMQSKGIVWGAAGLPVEFRQDEGVFEEGMKKLPAFAAGLHRAGVERAATWLMPCHDHLPYLQNFRRHATRLRQVAVVLGNEGVRLGLEYVAPKTMWVHRRYPFIHTMAEMKDLLAEMDAANAGLVLDSWHWWHAGDSAADILALKGREVIAVDLNDAPAGVAKDEQVDNRRELPCATGVIDVGAFLNALNQIGYDGPVRPEPFNQVVNQMPKEEACAAAAASMQKAFALIH